MVLAAHDLGWRARGRPIVAGVDLSVHEGEVLGIIGPNGSGKSTLLRLLAGLLKPATGRIDLKGQPMARMGARRIARLLAFVAQSSDTTDRITVRDATELGRTPWLDAWHPWSDADTAHVRAALTRVGMDGFETRDWITLSGGERQRVHIARALAQTPQILLLDEPTNHLDIHHQLSILRLIGQLGLSTVIALHDLNQAMTCDRLAVMHHGRLIALDTPGRVLTPELLHDVFAVQATELIDPADGARVLRFMPISERALPADRPCRQRRHGAERPDP